MLLDVVVSENTDVLLKTTIETSPDATYKTVFQKAFKELPAQHKKYARLSSIHAEVLTDTLSIAKEWMTA